MELLKEELPITGETCFYVPIHPALLSPDISIDRSIAHEVFARTAAEWHEDLSVITAAMEPGKIRTWYEEVFLKKSEVIVNEFGKQEIGGIDGWSDIVQYNENGFAGLLSISRNVGGTLYYNSDDLEGRSWIFQGGQRRFFRMPLEKAVQFGEVIDDDGTVEVQVYLQHNIDFLPGALFLRNWAINYMNEVFRQHNI